MISPKDQYVPFLAAHGCEIRGLSPQNAAYVKMSLLNQGRVPDPEHFPTMLRDDNLLKRSLSPDSRRIMNGDVVDDLGSPEYCVSNLRILTRSFEHCRIPEFGVRSLSLALSDVQSAIAGAEEMCDLLCQTGQREHATFITKHLAPLIPLRTRIEQCLRERLQPCYNSNGQPLEDSAFWKERLKEGFFKGIPRMIDRNRKMQDYIKQWLLDDADYEILSVSGVGRSVSGDFESDRGREFGQTPLRHLMPSLWRAESLLKTHLSHRFSNNLSMCDIGAGNGAVLLAASLTTSFECFGVEYREKDAMTFNARINGLGLSKKPIMYHADATEYLPDSDVYFLCTSLHADTIKMVLEKIRKNRPEDRPFIVITFHQIGDVIRSDTEYFGLHALTCSADLPQEDLAQVFGNGFTQEEVQFMRLMLIKD